MIRRFKNVGKHVDRVSTQRRIERYAAGLAAGCSVLAAIVLAKAATATPNDKTTTRVLPPRAISVAIFSTDDRIVLPRELSAFNDKIGLLYDRGSRSVCTAFCASKTIIATASHCLFKTAGETAPKLKHFTFRLASAPKSQASVRIAGAGSGMAAAHVMAGSARLSVRPPIDAGQDWALIRLERPACAAGGLPLSSRPAHAIASDAVQQRIYQVGFHRDFGSWQLALGRYCSVRRTFDGADAETIAHDFKDTSALILHTCDTGGASSGSPLLIDGPTGPEVIGINVGTYLQSRVLKQDGSMVLRLKTDTIANTAVSATAFASQLATFSIAVPIVDRENIRVIQSELAKHGHYHGPVDGVYGSMLRKSIAAFEEAERRPVTGLATADLQRRLVAIRAENEKVQPARSIASGARGPVVETGSIKDKGGLEVPQPTRANAGTRPRPSSP